MRQNDWHGIDLTPTGLLSGTGKRLVIDDMEVDRINHGDLSCILEAIGNGR